ncbi:MAG: ATP-binding protein [Vicinamibacterales bacterium]
MSGRPLLFQVSVLLAAVLLAVQAISFVVVLVTPAPVAPRMNLARALALLDDATAARAAGLHLALRAAAPEGPPADMLAEAVAGALGRDADEVRVVWRHADPETHASIQVVGATPDGAAGPHAAPHAPEAPAAQAILRQALLQPGLELPPFALALRQPDGQWLTLEPPDLLLPLWRLRLFLASALGALALAPVAWFAARRLTRPVRALAAAAAGIDLEGRGAAIEVEGPSEIRAAATAFNAMQARLGEQAARQTRMIAAVAHDLRTPLTGLRLRAESAPEEVRDRMVADIDRMRAMVTQVMDYVQGEQGPLEPEPLDLGTLVRDCAEAAVELGRDVRCVVPDEASFVGDPLALRRAVSNLIDNAVRYAGSARVTVHRNEAGWMVDVDDDGPGIPAAAIAGVLEPFRRLDDSRSRGTGGVGLGLAVVRSAAERHGGALVLANRAEGGLRARIRLPAPPPAP